MVKTAASVLELTPKAEKQYEVLMTFQDLISPRYTEVNIEDYGKATSYFDVASTDIPSTCTGPSVVKPIQGKSYTECAAACDAQQHDCVGFTFFPSQLCFLHRKINMITSYTGCAESTADPSSETEDLTRLSCAVKKAVFEELYPADTRETLIEWKQLEQYCPVYDDEGVSYATPIVLSASAFAEGSYIITAPGVYELSENVVFNPKTALTSGVSSMDSTF